MRSAYRSLVLVLVLLTLAGASCPSREYALATRAYEAESIEYVVAGDFISARRADGTVSDAQWSRFVADAAAVRVADDLVYADLELWRTSRMKPPRYETHAAALRAAQDRVIALSKEVR